MHMIQNHIIFWNDAQHDHHKFTQIKRILRNKSPNKIYLTNSNVQWSGWMERWVLVNGQLDILNSVMMLQTRWCKHWCKKNLVRESSSLYLHILQPIWEESRSRYAKQEAVYQKKTWGSNKHFPSCLREIVFYYMLANRKNWLKPKVDMQLIAWNASDFYYRNFQYALEGEQDGSWPINRLNGHTRSSCGVVGV